MVGFWGAVPEQRMSDAVRGDVECQLRQPTWPWKGSSWEWAGAEDRLCPIGKVLLVIAGSC